MGCASPVALLILVTCSCWLRGEGMNTSLTTAVTSANTVSPRSPSEGNSTPSTSPQTIAATSPFNPELMNDNYSFSALKYTSHPSTSPTFLSSTTPSFPSSAPPTFSQPTTTSFLSSASTTFSSSSTSSFSPSTATLFPPSPSPALPPSTSPSLPPSTSPSLPPSTSPSLPPATTSSSHHFPASLLNQSTVFNFPETSSQARRHVLNKVRSTAVMSSRLGVMPSRLAVMPSRLAVSSCTQNASTPTAMKKPTCTKNGTHVNITWKRSDDHESYEVNVTCTRSHDCCKECKGYEKITKDSSLILESEPGTNYSVRVRAKCNSNQTQQGCIEYEEITYSTVDKAYVCELDVTPSEKHLWLKWKEPCPYWGDLFDYISLDGKQQTLEKCHGNATLAGLKPFTNYTIEVHSKGNVTQCNSKQYTTLPDVPSPPRNLSATKPAFNNDTNQSRISDISWQPPKDLNGELKQYTLTYSVNGGISNNITVPVQDCTQDKCTYRLELEPEREYNFSVVAENKVPAGKTSEPATLNHTTEAGTPYFTTKESLSYEKDGVTQYSVKLLFNLTSISNANGKISSWEVWMQENDCKKMEIDKHVSIHKVFCTTSRDHSYIIPIVVESRTTNPDSDCPQYENESTLIPGECYIFAAVINTTANYSTSNIIRVQMRHSYVLIVCLTLGVAITMLLVVIAYGLYTRHYNYIYLHWAFHRGRAESITLPLVVSPPADVSVERSILLSDLPATVENLFSRGHIAMSREYADLKSVSPSKPCWNAQLPVNRSKTRYFNILPFDETRVVLKEYQNVPCSDFINASYIHGYSVAREFIACQGPLKNTVNDFWRMVWEKNVSVIVMVTQCIENSKDKCSKYWPDAGESLYFEKTLKVKNLQEKEQHQDGFVCRKLQLSKKNKIRFIHHFHFTSWPDMGCPATPDQLINFVKAVRTNVPKESSHVVVHCSAGVGRTGTFIGLSNLMEEMHEQSSIDVFHTVYKMRLHRTNMVQTEAQYAFLYKCVLKYYLDQTEQSQSWSAIKRRLERKDNIPDIANGALERSLAASENEEKIGSLAEPVTYPEANNEHVKEESSV